MNRTDGLWIGMKLLGFCFIILGLADLGYGIYGSIGAYLVDLSKDGYSQTHFMRYEYYRIALSGAIKAIGGLVLLRMATLVDRKQHKPD
jgi:hypothetical protein